MSTRNLWGLPTQSAKVSPDQTAVKPDTGAASAPSASSVATQEGDDVPGDLPSTRPGIHSNISEKIRRTSELSSGGDAATLRDRFHPTSIPWHTTFIAGSGIDLTSFDGNFGTGLKAFDDVPPAIDSNEIASSGLKKNIITDSTSLTSSLETTLATEGYGWGFCASASSRANASLKISSQSVTATCYAYCIMAASLPEDLDGFRMSADAKTLLSLDVDKFHTKYGTHFIAGYKKGSTFFGEMTIESNQREVDLASSIQLQVSGYGSGESKFASELESKKLKITTDFVATGGSVLPSDAQADDYKSLVQCACQATILGKRDDDKKISAIAYPYAALREYSQLVTSHADFAAIPTERALRELSTCYVWFEKLEKLLSMYSFPGQERFEKKVFESYLVAMQNVTTLDSYEHQAVKRIRDLRSDIIMTYNAALRAIQDPLGSPLVGGDPSTRLESKFHTYDAGCAEDECEPLELIQIHSNNHCPRMEKSFLAAHVMKWTDKRNRLSTFAMFHRNESVAALWLREPAPVPPGEPEWEVEPNSDRTEGLAGDDRRRQQRRQQQPRRKKEYFYLKLSRNLHATGFATEGRYLAAHQYYDWEKRSLDGRITEHLGSDGALGYANVHEGVHYAAVWTFHPDEGEEDAEDGGVGVLQLVHSNCQAWITLKGHYLSCCEENMPFDERAGDFRDSVSVYASLKKDRAHAAKVKFVPRKQHAKSSDNCSPCVLS